MVPDAGGWPVPLTFLIDVLTWLGVPLAIVGMLTVVSWAMTWVQAALKTIKVGRQVASGLRTLARQWSAQRLGATILFVPAGALLVASSYSISQLLQLMFTLDASGRNIADGELFDLSTQWHRLVLGGRWTQDAVVGLHPVDRAVDDGVRPNRIAAPIEKLALGRRLGGHSRRDAIQHRRLRRRLLGSIRQCDAW